MSSFLHSSKHFNSIEKSIIELKRSSKYSGFCYDIAIFEIELVIAHYREFSCICVINQYSNHYKNPVLEIQSCREALSDGSNHILLKPIELYKAMLSMEYQIEFDYLNRDLTDTEKIAIEKYKNIKDQLSYLIINSLPEYNNSNTWSIE